jgi:hypothetical protein
MATKIYEASTVELIDGTVLEITPLKIKYLREFMVAFDLVKESENDEDAVHALVECTRIAMKQFCPEIKTKEELEDRIDLPTIYEILDISAGIKISPETTEVRKEAVESGDAWEDLDLAKLEAEVFLIGIWKDYGELELSMSMPEIVATLGSKRDLDYAEKKFLAAIQGIDIDEQSGEDNSNAWEDMKARVFSGGQAQTSSDVVSLQGVNARNAGFGIGMGLDYEDLG